MAVASPTPGRESNSSIVATFIFTFDSLDIFLLDLFLGSPLDSFFWFGLLESSLLVTDVASPILGIM